MSLSIIFIAGLVVGGAVAGTIVYIEMERRHYSSLLTDFDELDRLFNHEYKEETRQLLEEIKNEREED